MRRLTQIAIHTVVLSAGLAFGFALAHLAAMMAGAR